MAPRCAQGGVRKSAPPGAGTRKALLPQHRRGVQTFNDDLAVGLSQSCRQDVEVMSTDVIDPAMQPGNLGGALTVTPRTFRAARPGPADMPQLFQCSIERAWVGDVFDHRAVSGGDSRQTPDPGIDTHPRTR